MEQRPAENVEDASDAAGMQVGADGVVRRVDPSLMKTDVIAWWIFGGIVFALGVVATLICLVSGVEWWVNGLIAGGTVAGMLLIAWGGRRLPRMSYERLSYVLTSEGLEIRRGVWWRSITSVPRSRIQHIDVVQGPILRRHGLANLVIHTAGTAEASVTLEGLSHGVALRIRDMLVQPDEGRWSAEGDADGV